MTIGYFAPLPPARTGVADYAADLLTALRRHAQILPNEPNCDVSLYQIGNNHWHTAIYDEALRRPGVILLHDAVLNHFLLGKLSKIDYIHEFVFNYGADAADLAVSLWNRRAMAGADERYFQYPMLKRVVEQARLVVVHNPAATARVKAHAPSVPVWELPHLFVPPATRPTPSDRAAVRARHQVSATTLLIGVFGHLRESKRIPAIVRAVAVARHNGADVQLLLAGEAVSPDLQRSLQQLAASSVILVPFLPEHEFWRYGAAVDVVANLRWPSAAETSGIGVRLMGLGRPVIFTEGPELDHLPRGTHLAVPSGLPEEEALAALCVLLAANRELGEEVGRAAAAHIAAVHDADLVAQKLLLGIRRVFA